MSQDKYSAVWVSYSGLSTFLKCPRAYYLQYMYKDPQTRRKISEMTPHLALGQVVHNTIEPLANVPAEKRFDQPIMDIFERHWSTISGEKGGFISIEEEVEMKERGRSMIKRVVEHPGALKRKATRIPPTPSGMPPNFYLSEEDNIILCGSIDWLEYLEDTDSVHIIDFKTGKREEEGRSLQLPMYLLLARNLQKRSVAKASYWYLDRSDTLDEKELPTYEDAFEQVLTESRKLKKAREAKDLSCPQGGSCFACSSFEKIIVGEATCIGSNEMNKDVYVVSR
ncbi:MAG: PD-(D/E)XK nuclease family protein [Candidatus Paceibacterota bacterium]